MTVPFPSQPRPAAGAADDPTPAAAPPMDRRTVAVIAAEGDDDAIEAFVANLPTERLAPAILQIHALRRALQTAEMWCESRYGEEVNASYTDPETGKVYVFSGTPSWKIADPEGFAALLKKLAEARPAFASRIRSAFKQVWVIDNRVINSIRDLDEELAEACRDFRTRVYGPKHLHEWEEDR